ncbi:hypothetical protein Nepgr_027196 [Nepenthes gracilis]|uniref:Uncharacterized protein n=1 Tax=Nepenthes gracilis TaxID=150966 RepID=A0AAD3T8I1_NEPGR|nr:hypothetical protein Nepgr_027196 [Nepenthes gracilis]
MDRMLYARVCVEVKLDAVLPSKIILSKCFASEEELVVEVEVEAPSNSLRLRPVGKSPRTGALSKFRPQTSSLSAGMSYKLRRPGIPSAPYVCSGDAGPVGCDQAAVLRVSLLGELGPVSAPGEIVLDGMNSLSPGVWVADLNQGDQQRVRYPSMIGLASDAEFSSDEGHLVGGGCSWLLPVLNPNICRQQMLLTSQSFSFAGNAIQIGGEVNLELPYLDVDRTSTPASCSSLSNEPPLVAPGSIEWAEGDEALLASDIRVQDSDSDVGSSQSSKEENPSGSTCNSCHTQSTPAKKRGKSTPEITNKALRKTHSGNALLATTRARPLRPKSITPEVCQSDKSHMATPAQRTPAKIVPAVQSLRKKDHSSTPDCVSRRPKHSVLQKPFRPIHSVLHEE